MDSDQGKLFIGGISWETTEDKLKDYFGSYGDVLQAVVMRDKITGRPRGFGFVVFADPAVLDRVLEDKHTIDGRTVRDLLISDSPFIFAYFNSSTSGYFFSLFLFLLIFSPLIEGSLLFIVFLLLCDVNFRILWMFCLRMISNCVKFLLLGC